MMVASNKNVILNDLALSTMRYWEVSKAWNNRPEARQVTVGEAMSELKDILSITNPARPLAACSGVVYGNIIQYGQKPKQRKSKSKQNPKAQQLITVL